MTAQRLLFVGLLTLTVSACSAEPRAPSPTEVMPETITTIPATTTTTLSVEEATTAFRACLTESGVSVDQIPLDSRGRPRLELAFTGADFADAGAVQAMTDCAELLTGGALDLSTWPQLQQQVQLTLESFSECVRSHGVITFPDPVNPFFGVGGPYPLEESPCEAVDLEAAVAVCSARVAEEG